MQQQPVRFSHRITFRNLSFRLRYLPFPLPIKFSLPLSLPISLPQPLPLHTHYLLTPLPHPHHLPLQSPQPPFSHPANPQSSLISPSLLHPFTSLYPPLLLALQNLTINSPYPHRLLLLHHLPSFLYPPLPLPPSLPSSLPILIYRACPISYTLTLHLPSSLRSPARTTVSHKYQSLHHTC